MTKTDRTEDALERLRTLEQEAPTAEGIGELRKLIRHRSSHVAGRACDLVSAWKAESLVSDLEGAFDRFMKNPVKTDPGCTGKLAIVRCLTDLEYPASERFLTGARHVQLEPAYEGPVDTAPGLRGACGRGLAVIQHPDVYTEHTALLMDAEPETRRIAIQTLAWLGSEQSELLLRMKVLATDPEPDVLGAAFQALMEVAPDRSFEFVASYLENDDLAIAEGAALSLGESKSQEAFLRLKSAWEESLVEPFRQMLALPVALVRSDESFDLLVQCIESASKGTALAIVRALALHGGDDVKVSTVREVVEGRHDRDISSVFSAVFLDET